jgi:hypothetical protein
VAKLAAVDALMQNNINRLRKLLEQQGHPADLTLWPNAHSTDVPIIATQARTYLGVLTKMDRVYTLSATANLLGVIDSAQRAEVELACKKSVRAFRSIVQSEVATLYREAERILRGQHPGDKADPAVEASPPAAGEALGRADENEQQGDAQDPALQEGETATAV